VDVGAIARRIHKGHQGRKEQDERPRHGDLAALRSRRSRREGEGGLRHFYNQQWKRFFETVPDAYRFNELITTRRGNRCRCGARLVRTEPAKRHADVVQRYPCRARDCSRCFPAGPIIERQNGDLYKSGVDAVAPTADIVLIEGFVNVDENAHLLETATRGRRYIDLTCWYASN
jgi:hypothetical protein